MKVEGLDELIKSLEKAKVSLPAQMDIWLEEIGVKALQLVRKEILARNLVDTRDMLNSFMKGGGDNIWEKSGGAGNSILQVGSSIDYALYLEMGYITKSGAVVYPKPFFSTAMRAVEIMIDRNIQKKFNEWIDSI